VPLGGYFLNGIPFHPASSIPFMSMLDYIANVSLSGYLVLYSLFFLYAAPSAQASHIRDGVFLLLSNLLGFIHKAFLLLYNKNDSFSIDTSSYKKFLINSSSSTTVHNDSLLDTALHTTTVTGTTTCNPTMAPQTWVDLHQIYFRFGEHYNPTYDKLHRALDMAYSTTIPDIDPRMEAPKVLSTVTQFKLSVMP